MADAYHPYIPDELPLNIPTNKRRERAIEASSYEATRPATIAALNESLLSSGHNNRDDDGDDHIFDSGSDMEDEEGDNVDYNIIGYTNLQDGQRQQKVDRKTNKLPPLSLSVTTTATATTTGVTPHIYDNEYETHRRASMDNHPTGIPKKDKDLVAEKEGATDRGVMTTENPVAVVTPTAQSKINNPKGQWRDPFAETNTTAMTTTKTKTKTKTKTTKNKMTKSKKKKDDIDRDGDEDDCEDDDDDDNTLQKSSRSLSESNKASSTHPVSQRKPSKRDVMESHARGLNNLLTLQSKRKMRFSWTNAAAVSSSGGASGSGSASGAKPTITPYDSYSETDFPSEIELFVETDDEGEGSSHQRQLQDYGSEFFRAMQHQTIPLPLDYDHPSNNNHHSEAEQQQQQPQRRRFNPLAMPHDDLDPHSATAADDPVVDIDSIKKMKQEDYWNLFEKILHTPHDFVPEDHMEPLEILEQQKREAREKKLAAATARKNDQYRSFYTKKRRNRKDRVRRRKSFDASSPTDDATHNDDAKDTTTSYSRPKQDIFEPPGYQPRRRRSSFAGTTGADKSTNLQQHQSPPDHDDHHHHGHDHHHHHTWGKIPFLNMRLVKPKQPVFVMNMKRRAREAFKFPLKKNEEDHDDDDGDEEVVVVDDDNDCSDELERQRRREERIVTA